MRVQLEKTVLAQEDLEEMRASLDRLFELAEAGSAAPRVDLRAHTTQVVLSYTRASENLEARAKALYNLLESALDQRLVTARKEDFAHSDRSSRGVTLVGANVHAVEFVIPISRLARRPFESTADLETLLAMLIKLEDYAHMKVTQLTPSARLD